MVIAILLAATAPRFSRTLRKLRLERTAWSLVQSLRFARAQAIILEKDVDWIWDSDDRWFDLAISEDGYFKPLKEWRLKKGSLSDDVAITLLRDGIPARRIRFFPDGTNESLDLTVEQPANSYTIAVDGATGQVVLSIGHSSS